MNVHLIPTDNPSRLGRIVATNNLFLKVQNDLPRGENVHVYITVDDTIKIEIIDNECRKLKFTKNETRIGKKVILTDNPTLIDSGVQAIPNDFLEWLVQNPSCEEVEIEKEHDDTVPYPKMRYVEPYKIVLPKEEPKQTDEKGNPLTYWGGLKEIKSHSFCETSEEKCTMNYCDKNGCQNRKRQLTDLEIAIRLEEIERDERTQETNFFESLQKYFKETPREKVLEDWNKSAHLDNVGPTVEEFVENSNEERFKEAAELYLENVNTKVHKDLERDGWMKIGFISGAKWQKNNYVKYISQLENHSFVGWSEDSINGYLTACATLKDNI